MKINDPATVAGAKTVQPIPPLVNQVGATCGLYALSCVIRYWDALLKLKGVLPTFAVPAERGATTAKTLKERLNDEIVARAGKPSASPTNFTGVKQPTGNLLDIAETLGSRVGEVFEAAALSQTASKAGLYSYIERWTDPANLWDMVKVHIDSNVPFIIAYDNTDTGDPGSTTHGSRAHWAVILGYVEYGNRRNVLATHGWGNYYLWSVESLRTSNEQLNQFGKWGTWYRSHDPRTGNVNWHGPDLPATPSAKPSSLPDNFNKKGAMPASKVAGFQIAHDLDLKKQIIIVLPRKVLDYSAPTTATTTVAKPKVSSGHHF